MKLVNKITLWLVVVVVLNTPLCMYLSYKGMQRSIEEVEIKRLLQVNNLVSQQIRNGVPDNAYANSDFVTVSLYRQNLPENRTEIQKTEVYNQQFKRDEYKINVNSYVDINGTNYLIHSYNYVATADVIWRNILDVQLWKWIFLILVLSLTATLISKYLFRPYRKSMEAIRSFNVKQKHQLHLPATNTKEFKELNCFLQKMTDKAMEDYSLMKEFSENASHELQTPLAILRNKLDLFTETNISENQAYLIADMQNAIDKLSRIHRSLTILTKLENQEFDAQQQVQFSNILNETLDMYSDTISMKNIAVNKRVGDDIRLLMHPALAELLVMNLVTNAIKHNSEGGFISIEANLTVLSVANSGRAPEVPTNDLFLRFKKGNSNSSGTGLGLAIVKQICDVSGFAVRYEYAEGVHTILVDFRNEKSFATEATVQKEDQERIFVAES